MSNPGGDALLSEPGRVYTEVIVHPLVLLSAVDHHYRVAREQAKKRVVGVLLGEVKDGRVDVTNSFALPFEEDGRDPDIFFCDHDYLERCAATFLTPVALASVYDSHHCAACTTCTRR
jgi:hypothetical protein